MEIEIIEIHNNTVNISTEFRNIVGTWRGSKLPSYEKYNIELEIDEILEWNKEIVLTSLTDPSIKSCGNEVNIIGCIESIDSDGYTVIRLLNNIVSFETCGLPFSIGKFVEVSCKNVEFFDVNF